MSNKIMQLLTKSPSPAETMCMQKLFYINIANLCEKPYWKTTNTNTAKKFPFMIKIIITYELKEYCHKYNKNMHHNLFM